MRPGPTKAKVFAQETSLRGKVQNVDPILKHTAGQWFYSVSLLDLTTLLNDPGTVAPANALPSIRMSIVQHVRLSDGLLVRLDMDRGVTPARHGGPAGEAVSWKRPLDAVLEEVLALVRADDPADPTAHPWEQLAETARLRGVDVDAEALSAPPDQVVLSAEAVETFVS